MKVDLGVIRESYGMDRASFAKLINIGEIMYSQYEMKSELPSKYVYLYWTKLKNFPIPDDFFLYTSFVLETNMRYHNMTQKQIAKMFDIANQSTISGYMQENIPMYEKKEYFYKFDPFVIPCILKKDNKTGKDKLVNITSLRAKGNFVLVEKRRLQKKRK